MQNDSTDPNKRDIAFAHTVNEQHMMCLSGGLGDALRQGARTLLDVQETKLSR